jgi:porin
MIPLHTPPAWITRKAVLALARPHFLIFIIAIFMPAVALCADSDNPPAGLMERDNLTGNWGGLRDDLKAAGYILGATETTDLLGVADGGVKRGAIVEGRLELDLDVNLDTVLGWDNTVLHASAYQIHGRGLSGNDLGGNILTVSNIEATRAFRLFDLWLEKGFFDNAFSLRLGQLAADDEFVTSQYAAALVNSTFGWPAITSLALPSGGPAYPLATPGIRVKAALSDAIAIQLAVFNGDPAGGSSQIDPQLRDNTGIAFNLNRGPFAIAEASWAIGAQSEAATPASILKLGAWYDADRFGDVALDRSGYLLSDTRSSGLPRMHNGNFGVYFIADQLLFHEPDTDDQGLGIFLRLSAAPPDRNFISVYVDSGLSYKGLIDGRDDDLISLGVAYAPVSDRARRLAADLLRSAGQLSGAPDGETAVELTYQIAVAPWWIMQPDIQYIIHPTPGVVRPVSAEGIAHAGNAAIFGLRSAIRF